jgi:hypothetical protein
MSAPIARAFKDESAEDSDVGVGVDVEVAMLEVSVRGSVGFGVLSVTAAVRGIAFVGTKMLDISSN